MPHIFYKNQNNLSNQYSGQQISQNGIEMTNNDNLLKLIIISGTR